MDYYRILGITPQATKEDIKQAYRQLVRHYHPDINKEALDQRIKQLNEAYRVLGDIQRRALYDVLRLKEEERAAVEEELRRRKAEAASMTWKEGVQGFVHELHKEVKNTDAPANGERMTWAEGARGFVEELKKEMKEE